MNLPKGLTLEEIVFALRRCKNETQLYGYFETLTNNDMKFWPDSCYQVCTEYLIAAMNNPKLPLYPYVNLQDEFEQTAKLFLSRAWVGWESKKDLPITNDEVSHMEKSVEEIGKESYLEMVKDIINNGTEYECRYQGQDWRSAGIWGPVDVTEGYKVGYEYRKKQPKTWLEENYPISKERDDNDVPYGISEVDAIKDFFEEFIRRFENKYVYKDTDLTSFEMKKIAKEMGVEVDD